MCIRPGLGVLRQGWGVLYLNGVDCGLSHANTGLWMLVILIYGANRIGCAVRAGSFKTAAKSPAKSCNEQ